MGQTTNRDNVLIITGILLTIDGQVCLIGVLILERSCFLKPCLCFGQTISYTTYISINSIDKY